MPSNYLGDYFNTRRVEKGLSLGQVARLLGYKNVSKGANKVQWFEQEGSIRDDLLLKLMKILDIEPSTVQALTAKDREEHVRQWNDWADEPVPMRIVVRYIPGLYAEVPLPKNIKTEAEAEAYCRDLAQRGSQKVFLVVSRRLTITINEEGEVTGRLQATPDFDPVPYMQVGRRKFLFHFGKTGDAEPEKRGAEE